MSTIESLTARCLSYHKTDPPMQRGFVVVRVQTSDGVVGWGEASSNWGHSYPTVVETVVRDVIAPNLVGTDASAIRARLGQMHVLLDGYLGWEGLTSQVIGAVEIALWDALGKAHGVPVSTLLGGGIDRIPLYGTGTTMFEESADWHAHYFDQALSVGFRNVKVRLGKNPDSDVELVRVVKDHIGPERRIMADAYWGYSPEEAIALTERLKPLGVYFFEEPCPQYDVDGLARLAARSLPVRIAGGERIYSPAQYRMLAERQAIHVFQPDATLCGGLLACLEIATIAKQIGLEVIPHVGGPTAIGLAANLQWAAVADVPMIEWDIDPHQPLVDNVAPELALTCIRDGVAIVPGKPGLGIEFDEAVFDDYPHVKGGTYAEVFTDHETGRID
ncbi:MAG: mandelate racemase/muconate lactonizing enzyme family protein [Ilumatobacteraceae bacterium]